ncbi:PREDICTED: gamma-glutamyltranspeptidase 1-like isoform X2 [Dinoponera quadriceps]|uniref:Gamma-glutamyltranspeptidase 1-like isoform X2 n=1 Tax=Dinoponera quadriceps TaxID=609295 RepID=A0A6P3WN72_DINQU|nr:PREDICTED: gamma-glutamyltranspeptidase 1-like isoform X2 [Dinoponera quadriceps]
MYDGLVLKQSVRKRFIVVGMSAATLLGILMAIVIVLVTRTTGYECGPKFISPSKLGLYKKGAVTTNGQECAAIGADILAKNGSAVDATIAALLCEGIASLHSMGLGGGFLMTIWDAKNKKADFLDAREIAPLAATEDMFDSNAELSMYGGLSIAVPGEVMGYWEAHQKYGRLNWADLFESAIALCEKGSIVNDYLAAYLLEKAPMIKKESTLAEILINPVTNEPWVAGDRIKRPKLAKTLRLLAINGPNIFYNGVIADELVKEIARFKGIITKRDFETYKAVWRKPITIKIGNLTIHSAPPPGSGAVLTFILNVLHRLIPVSNEHIMWQRIVETFKWAYARRTELGDPEFVDNIDEVIANLTSNDYADMIRDKISDYSTSQYPEDYGAITEGFEDGGTAHISVLAPDGSAVSVTSTINQVLGAMIRSNSTGIIFNDEMDDFSSPNITNGFGLPPSPANFIQPRKRPLSSMCPSIVLDANNDVRLVIGAAGGTKITSGVAIGMILNLFNGYNIKEAIDAHRLHHQLLPMNVQNERDFCKATLCYLRKIGHNVTTFSGIGSAITGIAKEKGYITANSDYRRQGRSAGF